MLRQTGSDIRTGSDAARAPFRSSVLEEKHMVSIMLYLMENEGCRKTVLYDGVSSSVRMPDKLDRLESSGLIRQVAGAGNSVTLHLTDVGRTVAMHLRTIDEAMGLPREAGEA